MKENLILGLFLYCVKKEYSLRKLKICFISNIVKIGFHTVENKKAGINYLDSACFLAYKIIKVVKKFSFIICEKKGGNTLENENK